MTYNTDFTLIVSQTEVDVIRELCEILNRCPYNLTNDDYAEIIRAIGHRWDSADHVTYLRDKTINIVYEEEEK